MAAPAGGWPNDPSVITNGGPLPPMAIPGIVDLPLELADYALRVPGIDPERRYDFHIENEAWRAQAGIRGEFDLGSKPWAYDFGLTYGENTYSTHALEIDKDRLELAM